MKKTIVITIALMVLCPFTAASKTIHKEKWYQQQWCEEQRGVQEVVLPDQTRCDCLTATNAVEFDFGKKWAEAIGQALYYSLQTGKKAGIVLILETPKDRKYWLRLNSTIEHYNLPIDAWAVDSNGIGLP
ncbi:MAG: hypothetical protein OEV73_00165 [Desulfobulbaceae bacterium]|nr:hypothetical protein [Desulfobulbaceae bacterium]